MLIEKIKRYFILLVAICGLLISCHIKKGNPISNGFVLQRFEVINYDLGTILKSLKDSATIHVLNQDDDIIVLMLKQLEDSTLGFFIQRSSKVHFSNNFVANSNSRIVGYIEDKNLPTERIIVLSDVSSIFDFENIFYKFIRPTKDKNQFDYIYFPDDQYIVNEKGEGRFPLSLSGYTFYYIYKDGKINNASN